MHESYLALSDFLHSGATRGLKGVFIDPEPEQIAVLYRNGYLRSCREALQARFPSVAASMGESAFRTACYAFAQKFPPTGRTLTAYGSEFPVWLSRYEHASSDRAWIDLARLDSAWLDCLYGPDESPLSASQLNERIQALGGHQPELRLPRNAVLVSIDTAVYEAWTAIRQGKNALDRSIPQETRLVLFWRPDMTVLSRKLDAWEEAFYHVFLATDDLDEAVKHFPPCDTGGQGGSVTLEHYFARLIDAGMLTAGDE